MNGFIACVRRLPNGKGIKTSKNFANLYRFSPGVSDLPVGGSSSNLQSYFTEWSLLQTRFINYGSSRGNVYRPDPPLINLQTRSFSSGRTKHLSSGAQHSDQQAGSHENRLYGGASEASPSAPPVRKKTTIIDLKRMHRIGNPITMMTAYDYPSALHCDAAGIDALLVGDSLGMVVLGDSSTVAVTMDDILHHSRAVGRGSKHSFLIGDMPFGSYLTVNDALKNACRLLKEGGVDSVKLEGGLRVVPQVEALTGAGILVVGHIGLTPQTASAVGGFRLQGKNAAAATDLLRDALALQTAGACMIVLEMVPAPIARFITAHLKVPTIGIGAGSGTSGQVLVYHDTLGMLPGSLPRFVHSFAQTGDAAVVGLSAYKQAVRSRQFPAPRHSFQLSSTQMQPVMEAMRSAAMDCGVQPSAASSPSTHGVASTSAPATADAVVEGHKVVRSVAVVGGGSLGSLLAGQIAEGNPHVKVFLLTGNAEHADAINTQGLLLQQPPPPEGSSALGGDMGEGCNSSEAHGWPAVRTQRIFATSSTEEVLREAPAGVDAVLVAVKQVDTQRAAQQASALLPTDGSGCALILQNGMGGSEVLAAAVGPQRVLAGVTSLGASLLGAGSVKMAGQGATHIAPLQDASPTAPASQMAPAMVELLGGGPLPFPIAHHSSPSLLSLQWGKLLVNASVNAATALLGCSNGQLLTETARPLLQATASETAAVAAAAGVLLPYDDPLEEVRAVLSATAGNRSSMLQDRQRGQPTEVQAINGFICSEGRRLGVATPVNDSLLALISTLPCSPATTAPPTESAQSVAVSPMASPVTASAAAISAAAPGPVEAIAARGFCSVSGSSSPGPPLLVLDSIDAMQQWRQQVPAGQTVGLVPTMGALHEGHLQLCRAAQQQGVQQLVGSVFVNPAQFAPTDDFDAYPRQLARDCALFREEGAVAVFTPSSEDMYPEPYLTYVSQQGMDEHGEGAARPGFFRGVATVVAKLLNIVQPDLLFLGQKDGQQCIVLAALVRDLNMRTQVVVVPTARAPDGLALSSRNVYLTVEQRAQAPAVYASLLRLKDAYASGERCTEALRAAALSAVVNSPLLVPQYVCFQDGRTAVEVEGMLPSHPGHPVLVSVAFKVGATRLIDNILLN